MSRVGYKPRFNRPKRLRNNEENPEDLLAQKAPRMFAESVRAQREENAMIEGSDFAKFG